MVVICDNAIATNIVDIVILIVWSSVNRSYCMLHVLTKGSRVRVTRSYDQYESERSCWGIRRSNPFLAWPLLGPLVWFRIHLCFRIQEKRDMMGCKYQWILWIQGLSLYHIGRLHFDRFPLGLCKWLHHHRLFRTKIGSIL